MGLEDYLGRLFFNSQHKAATTPTSAYVDMIDLYTWEVVETTSWMTGRTGPIKRVIQKELAAGRRVSVITFNIDLLIENALQELTRARPGAAWCISQAYGFASPLSVASRTSEVYDIDGVSAEIPLYKLHGSVNWVFQHRDYYPPADLVSKPRTLWLLVDKEMQASRLKLRPNRTRRGRSVWYAFPLIVPPIYEKHAFIRMHLQEVWDNAEAALQTADRVVFWGYSFPSTDTHARHFFESLAAVNPVLRTPVVINPDPATGAALWPLLRATRVTQYADVSTYLAAT